MTYITLVNGIQLVSELDKEEIMGLIIKSEREGKSWVKTVDGSGYYRASSVVSVSDTDLSLVADQPLDTSFVDVILGHRKKED